MSCHHIPYYGLNLIMKCPKLDLVVVQRLIFRMNAATCGVSNNNRNRNKFPTLPLVACASTSFYLFFCRSILKTGNFSKMIVRRKLVVKMIRFKLFLIAFTRSNIFRKLLRRNMSKYQTYEGQPDRYA